MLLKIVKYESNGNEDKILTPKEYLNMIRPYLVDMINDHKKEPMENSINGGN